MDIREHDLYNMMARGNYDSEIKNLFATLENILKTLKNFERRLAKLEKRHAKQASTDR